MPLKDWPKFDYSEEHEKGNIIGFNGLKELMEQLNKEEIRFTLHTWKAQGEVLEIPLFNSIGHTVFPSSKEEDIVYFRTIDYWTRSKELSPADTIIQKSGLMKADGTIKEYPQNLRDK